MDPFRKVQAGQEVGPFSATAWNAMLEAAQAQRSGRVKARTSELTTTRDASIVRVKNGTGGPLSRRSVLGLDGPLFTPSDSLDAFLREVVFRGVTPTADHIGKFAITLEPAPADAVVRAYVAGVVQVKVDVSDPAHTCADVDAGSTGALASMEGGSAQILWREGDDSYSYSDGEQWAIVRLGTTCGGSSSGGGGRCDCPEDSYTVEVDCGDCGAYGYYYASGATMPKYWWITVGDAHSTDYAYADACDAIECEQLAGYRIRLSNVEDEQQNATCVWTGASGVCVQAELTVDGDHWKLTILDRDACVLGVWRIALDAFACCGTNSDWQADDNNSCELDLSLSPDPCTCCPEPTCPPDGQTVCNGAGCCLEDCNCNLNVTVSNLYTPTPVACTAEDTDCTDGDGNPCSFGDPDCFTGRPTDAEVCGGMNGVYAFTWDGDCTWHFRGIPAGGSTRVGAELTLAGNLWRLEILGADGQSAVFESVNWACEHLVELVFTGGSCPAIEGNEPVAEFNLCLTVGGY